MLLSIIKYRFKRSNDVEGEKVLFVSAFSKWFFVRIFTNASKIRGWDEEKFNSKGTEQTAAGRYTLLPVKYKSISEEMMQKNKKIKIFPLKINFHIFSKTTEHGDFELLALLLILRLVEFPLTVFFFLLAFLCLPYFVFSFLLVFHVEKAPFFPHFCYSPW